METHTNTHANSAPAASHRLPEWARIVLTMLAMFLAYLPIIGITMIPAVTEGLKSTNYWANLSANLAGQGSVGITMLLLAILMVRLIDRRPVRSLGLRLGVRALAALIVGTALATGVMYATTYALNLAGVTTHIDPTTPTVANVPVALLIVFIIGRAFLLQGFGEEVLFRGYLLQSLNTRPQRAVWVSAAAFGILHLVSQGAQEGILDRFLFLLLPFGFAVLAGHLAILMRSAWVAIGIHGGMHVGAMSAMQWLQWDSGSMSVTIASGIVFLILGIAAGRFISPERWDEVAAHGPYAQR